MDINKEKILENVKVILNDFNEKVKDIDINKEISTDSENLKCFREEGEKEIISTQKNIEEFRNSFLKNATKSNQDHILAEKGHWEE